MSNVTPAQLAEIVKSDGRTVRKFLRSVTPKEDQPGKGSRWALPGDKRSITKFQKDFAKWSAAQAEEAAKRAQAKAEEAAAQVDDDEVELDD